jgi:hypothetical protein
MKIEKLENNQPANKERLKIRNCTLVCWYSKRTPKKWEPFTISRFFLKLIVKVCQMA